MTAQPTWMNRGKTLYIPSYFTDTLGVGSSGPIPGAIDTSGLEILSFHFVFTLSGIDEGSTITFRLNGTNAEEIPSPFTNGSVPLMAHKIDGWAPVPSIASPDIVIDAAAATPVIIAYKELPRYVTIGSLAVNILGSEPTGSWTINVFGWMV